MGLSVIQSSFLSGTKTQSGTHRFCSAGAMPYWGVCLFFFAFGAAKVAKTVLLLSGQWRCPLLSSSEKYKYLHLGGPLVLRSSWDT
jgi:hypothetical protein